MGISQALRKMWVWLKGGDSGIQEPDWAIILSTMYQSEPPDLYKEHISTQRAYNIGSLIETSRMDNGKVRQATTKLEDWGLVNRETKTIDSLDHEVSTFQLTKDGFQVAHERELSNKSNRINQSLVFFTSVLVLAEIVGILPAPDIGKSILILMMLIMMLIVVRQTEIMD